MNTFQHDDSRRMTLSELRKVAAWPCGLALLVFCIASLSFGLSHPATWSLAATSGASVVAIRMLQQSADNSVTAHGDLIGVTTALVLWLWCVAAGFAAAEWSELVALKWVGFLGPLVLWFFYFKPRQQQPDWHDKFCREGSVEEYVDDIARYWKAEPRTLAKALPFLNCAGIRLPAEAARKLNFLVVGSIGSGKTTILKLMMQSVLPAIRPDQQMRAVVYDAKNELLPFIDAVKCSSASVFSLNPYDRRAYAWDVAADCRTLQDAQEMAIALVPKRIGNTSNDYFTDTSRLLTSSTMITLKDLYGDNWDLVDVVKTILDKNSREKILRSSPEGQLIVDNLGSSETEQNNMSSVLAFFGRLLPLANMMRHHAAEGRKLSINEWIRSPSILVLGGKGNAESPLSALNRVIVERLQNVLVDSTNNPKSVGNRTFLFFDEYADLGQLDATPKLMRLGRDFGVCTVIAFQTLPDLIDAHREQQSWKALLGQVGNLVLLRKNDRQTAEWGSQAIGTTPVESGTSVTTDCKTRRKTKSKVFGGPLHHQPIIDPSRFQSLTVADGRGVVGFFKSGLSLVVPSFFIPWEVVTGFPESSDMPAHVPCPREWQRVESDWLNSTPMQKEIDANDSQPTDEELESYLDSLKRAKSRRRRAN